jgi:hypothetical protein
MFYRTSYHAFNVEEPGRETPSDFIIPIHDKESTQSHQPNRSLSKYVMVLAGVDKYFI